MAAPSPRRRVLFVEDELALRLSYERFFAGRFDAVFAANGAEALRHAAAAALDVVVLDLRLPDTDGIDLLRRLRDLLPGIPVIITSAYVSLEPQLQVLALAHSGYFVKPFDLQALAARIDDVR